MIFLESTFANKVLGMRFLEVIFNERQAGKDQCDQDSATAKCQMN